MSELHTGSVEDRVKSVIAEQLCVEPSELGIGDSLVDDHNADSMDLVEMVMALEDKFNFEITDDEAEKFRTVGDVIECVSRKV